MVERTQEWTTKHRKLWPDGVGAQKSLCFARVVDAL